MRTLAVAVHQKNVPLSDKVATKQANKTNKQTAIFPPKINKVFPSPILQNLKGRFWTSFFHNYTLDEPKKMLPNKKVRKSVKNAKW